MNRLKKIIVIVFVSLAFPIILGISSFFVLRSSPTIYNLIPQDADIIIQLNTKNLIKDVIYQRLYNEDYFLDKIDDTEKKPELDNKNYEFGIDLFSQLVIFRESWADETIWFSVIKIMDQNKFSKFCSEYQMPFEFYIDGDYALLQLTPSINQTDVSQHIKNIAAKQVKSFDSKIDLSEAFNSKNEINIYLAPKKSKYLIDGFLSVNFDVDQINLDGNFSIIADTNDMAFIASAPNQNSAFSLRSSLNLFNSVYLLNNKKIKNIPDYHQLALDIDGSTLIKTNAEIPLIAQPHLNLQLTGIDYKTWNNYIGNIDANEGVKVDTLNHTIVIDKEGKAHINYNLTESKFSLFQNTEINFEPSQTTDTYFELQIKPQFFIEHTIFTTDSLNPPSFTDNLKIGMVQSMMENMSYLNDVSDVNFTIKNDPNSTDLISKGIVKYNSNKGHSIVESIAVLQKLVSTLSIMMEE